MIISELKPYERNVHYYETDKMGIVHHSNYIRIFEETRVFYLEQTGISFDEIEARGILMPALSMECNYKSPLVFNEPFASYAIATKFNGTVLNVEYRVVSKRTGEISVTGKSSHCFTNTDLKPVRLKNSAPDIYQIFQDFLEYDPFGTKAEKNK